MRDLLGSLDDRLVLEVVMPLDFREHRHQLKMGLVEYHVVSFLLILCLESLQFRWF